MIIKKVLSITMIAAVLVVGASQYAAMADVKDAVTQNHPNHSTEQTLPTPLKDSIQIEPINPTESPTTFAPSIVRNRGGRQFPIGPWCRIVPFCNEGLEQLHLDELRNNTNVPSDLQLPRTPQSAPSSSQLRREG